MPGAAGPARAVAGEGDGGEGGGLGVDRCIICSVFIWLSWLTGNVHGLWQFVMVDQAAVEIKLREAAGQHRYRQTCLRYACACGLRGQCAGPGRRPDVQMYRLYLSGLASSVGLVVQYR